MWGVLHIIPCPSFKREPRILVMRQSPSMLLLDVIVGGDRRLVEGFNTILYKGAVVPCLVYQGSEAREEENPYANLLWLQAQVRENGFSAAKTPNSIKGSVAILHGNDQFMMGIDHDMKALAN